MNSASRGLATCAPAALGRAGRGRDHRRRRAGVRRVAGRRADRLAGRRDAVSVQRQQGRSVPTAATAVAMSVSSTPGWPAQSRPRSRGEPASGVAGDGEEDILSPIPDFRARPNQTFLSEAAVALAELSITRRGRAANATASASSLARSESSKPSTSMTLSSESPSRTPPSNARFAHSPRKPATSGEAPGRPLKQPVPRRAPRRRRSTAPRRRTQLALRCRSGTLPAFPRHASSLCHASQHRRTTGLPEENDKIAADARKSQVTKRLPRASGVVCP